MAKDQAGGGRKFQRIADTLRDELARGVYQVGAVFPPQRVLEERFGVARDTVQRVVRELVSEGWIETHPGSGTRVVKTQRIHSPALPQAGRVTLGPLINRAFEATDVTLDVYTLTAESLDAHIHLQAGRVRAGEIAPLCITVRLLLPSEEASLAYPKAVSDAQDPRPLERLHDISKRHLASLRSSLIDLQTEKLVETVNLEVRRSPLTPAFKLYLLNGTDALHGFYKVVKRPIELTPGQVIETIDVLGFGATLFHYVKDQEDESQGSLFVKTAQAWLESHWELLSAPDDSTDRTPRHDRGKHHPHGLKETQLPDQ